MSRCRPGAPPETLFTGSESEKERFAGCGIIFMKYSRVTLVRKYTAVCSDSPKTMYVTHCDETEQMGGLFAHFIFSDTVDSSFKREAS